MSTENAMTGAPLECLVGHPAEMQVAAEAAGKSFEAADVVFMQLTSKVTGRPSGSANGSRAARRSR
ncbi:MAG: hypothetical protein KGL39_47660 [Patescibacteria group bacterium]|nr:hypothetical protein [Patescibacteria group bacterium]